MTHFCIAQKFCDWAKNNRILVKHQQEFCRFLLNQSSLGIHPKNLILKIQKSCKVEKYSRLMRSFRCNIQSFIRLGECFNFLLQDNRIKTKMLTMNLHSFKVIKVIKCKKMLKDDRKASKMIS